MLALAALLVVTGEDACWRSRREEATGAGGWRGGRNNSIASTIGG
jgi:hypothetical protein